MVKVLRVRDLIGPQIVGALLCFLFYGLFLSLLWSYFQKFKRDKLIFRIMVAALILCSTENVIVAGILAWEASVSRLSAVIRIDVNVFHTRPEELFAGLQEAVAKQCSLLRTEFVNFIPQAVILQWFYCARIITLTKVTGKRWGWAQTIAVFCAALSISQLGIAVITLRSVLQAPADPLYADGPWPEDHIFRGIVYGLAGLVDVLLALVVIIKVLLWRKEYKANSKFLHAAHPNRPNSNATPTSSCPSPGESQILTEEQERQDALGVTVVGATRPQSPLVTPTSVKAPSIPARSISSRVSSHSLRISKHLLQVSRISAVVCLTTVAAQLICMILYQRAPATDHHAILMIPLGNIYSICQMITLNARMNAQQEDLTSVGSGNLEFAGPRSRSETVGSTSHPVSNQVDPSGLVGVRVEKFGSNPTRTAPLSEGAGERLDHSEEDHGRVFFPSSPADVPKGNSNILDNGGEDGWQPCNGKNGDRTVSKPSHSLGLSTRFTRFGFANVNPRQSSTGSDDGSKPPSYRSNTLSDTGHGASRSTCKCSIANLKTETCGTSDSVEVLRFPTHLESWLPAHLCEQKCKESDDQGFDYLQVKLGHLTSGTSTGWGEEIDRYLNEILESAREHPLVARANEWADGDSSHVVIEMGEDKPGCINAMDSFYKEKNHKTGRIHSKNEVDEMGEWVLRAHQQARENSHPAVLNLSHLSPRVPSLVRKERLDSSPSSPNTTRAHAATTCSSSSFSPVLEGCPHHWRLHHSYCHILANSHASHYRSNGRARDAASPSQNETASINTFGKNPTKSADFLDDWKEASELKSRVVSDPSSCHRSSVPSTMFSYARSSSSSGFSTPVEEVEIPRAASSHLSYPPSPCSPRASTQREDREKRDPKIGPESESKMAKEGTRDDRMPNPDGMKKEGVYYCQHLNHDW
ncbi:hypothetical protein IE53DRAFT_370783 [Violaceomyces palustris]|uniref:Uncharacterized protein n=1 Tax=Violaceomyces palustris TaxID=1673888 RepID=A0ACD0NR13_9BASI|nr:hypothetical protein IE53DRAFT_370783 [Violaceomyces palustris]